MESIKSIRASLYIDGKPAVNSMKDVTQQTQVLRKELNNITIGTEEWSKKLEELQKHEKVLGKIKDEVKGVGGAFGFLKTEIGKMGALAAGFLGFQFLTEQFHNIIDANAKLSDSIADVRKTTGLGEEAVRRLQSSFSQIDTRSSRAQLTGLAEVAGKLGISTEKDVLGFVRAADQINVALGKDLGNAEEAINNLGKLAEIFKIKDTYGLENALLKTGSAINDLGAAGTANEGYIVEFTKRMGGIAPTANMSIQDILGLAATMDELGQPVEAAATAIGQFVVGMGNDIPRYAKLAKMSVAEFSNLLKTDGNAALIGVLKNLNSTGQGVKGLAENMGLIGEEGARATAALGLLSNNTELLEQMQKLSNGSFQQGISLTNEYNLKNNNFAATVDKLGKKFNALVSNTTVTNFLVKGTEVTGQFVDALNKGSGTIAMFAKLLIAAGLGWVAYTAVVRVAIVTQKSWWATLLESEAITKLIMVREAAWTALKLLLTGRIKEARMAMLGFNAVMEANPIGLVIAAITALVAAMYLMDEEVTAASKAQEALNKVKQDAADKTADEKDKIKALTTILNDNTESRKHQLDAVKALRELMPKHLQAYTDEQILAGKARVAIDEYVAALDRKADAESAEQALSELKKQRRLVESKPGEATFWDKAKASIVGAGIGAGGAAGKLVEYAQENKEKELAMIDAQIAAVSSRYKEELKNKLLAGNNAAGGGGFDLASATKDQLTVQLAADEKAISQLTRGTDAYNKVALEMVAIRKRLKEINKDTGVGGDGSHGDPAKALKEQSKALSTMVQEFNAKSLADLQTKNQKEIDETANSYNEKINRLKAFIEKNKSSKYKASAELQQHQAEIDQLEVSRNAATNAVRVRQEKDLLEKIKDLRGSLDKIYSTELESETQRINNFYDDQLRLGADASIIEEARAKDLANAKIREEQRFQEDVNAIRAQGVVTEADRDKVELERIHKKYEDQRKALKEKYKGDLADSEAFKAALALLNGKEAKETADYRLKETREKVKFGAELAQSMSDAIFEIGRNSRQAETDAEINRLEAMKDKELSAKNLTESQKSAINEKYRKQEADIKLKAWEADRAAAMKQAIINGALAVVKALPNPFAAIAAGVAAAAQIAVIAAQEAPQFAGGGFSDEDPAGYVGQPTIFKRSASGRPFVAGEAGREWIAPNWMLQNPRTANIIGMLESARRDKRAFATGGFNGAGAAPVIQNNFDIGILVSKLDQVQKAFEEKEFIFSTRVMDANRAREEAVRNAAKG